jgi:Zn-dependent protease/predicted transcriptional regulator
MTETLQLGRVLGIPVRLHWSWFLILGVLTWSLAAGYLPVRLPAASAGELWVYGFLAALLLFASVLLHEMSHAMMARRYGLPVAGITLHVFGGVSELQREPDSPRSEFLMAVVGPVTSYGVAGACWVILRLTGLGDGAVAVLEYLLRINILVGTFNLVPGFPLDGGRLLRSLLWAWGGSLARATQLASRIGEMVGLVLVFWGGMRLFAGAVVGGLWFILIGLFLRQAAASSYQQLVWRRSLERIPVRDAMTRDVIAVPGEATIERVVDDYFWPHHVASFPVLDDGQRVAGVVTMGLVKSVPRERWGSTAVREIMTPLRDDLTIAPGASCWEAFEKLARNDIGRVVVLADRGLVGYLSIKDVLHLIQVEAAAGGARGTSDRRPTAAGQRSDRAA